MLGCWCRSRALSGMRWLRSRSRNWSSSRLCWRCEQRLVSMAPLSPPNLWESKINLASNSCTFSHVPRKGGLPLTGGTSSYTTTEPWAGGRQLGALAASPFQLWVKPEVSCPLLFWQVRALLWNQPQSATDLPASWAPEGIQ